MTRSGSRPLDDAKGRDTSFNDVAPTSSIAVPDETLRLYALVRGDLKMPPGKLAAQAGHAFLESFRASKDSHPDTAAAYEADPPGTKVVLSAPNEYALRRAQFLCEQAGLPHFLVTDSGHVMPPYFDGRPIVTALGIGPCLREEVSHVTDRLALVR